MVDKFIKLTIALCIVTFISFPASAEKVVDVMTYAKSADLKDLYSQANLMQRCAGVVMGYAKYLPADMKKQKLQFSKFAENLIVEAGGKLYEKKQNSNEDNLKQNMTAFLFYTDHYYKMIEKTQLATGSIFAGAVFDELNFCKKFFLKK